MAFLDGFDGTRRTWHDRDGAARARGIDAIELLIGSGHDGLEVAHALADDPRLGAVRDLWQKRHGRAAAPLLLLVGYPAASPTRALVCGPAGDNPLALDLDYDHACRLAAAALAEPNRHAAIAFLVAAMDGDPTTLPGLRNKGLLATHALQSWVPQELDWEAAGDRARPLIGLRDHDLIRELGYQVETKGNYQVLRTGQGNARAVAVFLHATEQPDQSSPRFSHQTPVTAALSSADRENLPWVLSVRGGTVRLYSTRTSGAAGQRGRAETFVELNLPLLATDHAAYLDLLVSADALDAHGTLETIRDASADYTSALSKQLRERVYNQVVPRLAVAVATKVGGRTDDDLRRHYRTALTILFRLMFIAYAEDSRLLPLHVNGDYTDHALKTRARRIADAINAGNTLGFDNPFNSSADGPPASDGSTHLWTDCLSLFRAVNDGAPAWGVPTYNGGLFSTNPEVSPVGDIIDTLTLTNAEFGPALAALIVSDDDTGRVGPIDFRSLSVREFGTIYEGLLASELAVADQPLTLDDDEVYVPARGDDPVVVDTGGFYLHNTSGARKASGAYFTKPFAVDHLLDRALEPTLAAHLDHVASLVHVDREGDAAAALFDFRVADIAMGSGHFLTAVVDRLEARYSVFLVDNPIPQVTRELDQLRQAAKAGLGQLADTVELETSTLLRRLIARRCVYGVDINPMSVELARVSMWIHTFVPGLPLSFLNHNLVTGNSLSGVATIDEATAALTPDGGQPSLLDDPVRHALHAADDPLRRLATITDATTADIANARAAANAARTAVEPVTRVFDLITAHRLGKTDAPMLTDLDDVDDLLTSSTRDEVRLTRPLHFPVAFPEVFLRDRPGFDVLVGNPPWDKVQVLTDEFWARHVPGLQGMSNDVKDDVVETIAQSRPDLVATLKREKDEMAALSTVLNAGPYDIGGGNPDLCQMFAWRNLDLLRQGGRAGIVFPRGTVLAGDAMEGWRREVLRRGRLDADLLLNRARWVFDIHPQYGVALTTIAPGQAPQVSLRGPFTSLDHFRLGVTAPAATIPAGEFLTFSGRAALPTIESPDELPVLRRLLRHPRIGQHPDFTLRGIQGDLNATTHKKQFSKVKEQPSPSSPPVISGAAFGLWNPDAGTPYGWAERTTIEQFLLDRWNRQVRNRGSGYYGEAPLTSPIGLPYRRARLAWRPNSRSTDSRTVIACLVPPGTVCQNRAQFFYPKDGSGPREEAFLLGVICTRVFDWVARRFVETTVTLGLMDDLPCPRAESPGAGRVIEIAGRLAAVDARYSEWAGEVGVPVGSVDAEEKRELLIELDALVARMFALDADDLQLVYSTFHPTWNYEPFMEAVTARHRGLDFDRAAEARR